MSAAHREVYLSSDCVIFDFNISSVSKRKNNLHVSCMSRMVKGGNVNISDAPYLSTRRFVFSIWISQYVSSLSNKKEQKRKNVMFYEFTDAARPSKVESSK